MMLPFASSYSFGDALLTVLEIALFIAWLFLLFYVFTDIFRSHDLSGLSKALWCLLVFIFPMLGCLVYLLVRGSGIHHRAVIQAQHNEDAVRRYIREAAGTQGSSSLDELERLSALHQQGSLSDQQFERAKDQLLGT